MRRRLTAVLALVFLALLAAPAAYADGESLKGVVKGPDGKGIAGVTISATQDDSEVGTTETGADGTWTIPVPGTGKYDVTLDTDSLPDSVQMRTVGGEVRADVQVRSGQQRNVLFPLISSTEQQQPGTPAPTAEEPEDSSPGSSRPDITVKRVAQLTVEGIKLGAIIAITAVGLSLVFGTTRLINFAHGELVTLGAVTAYWMSTKPGNIPLVLATIVAVAIGGLVGAAMERGIWRPMRARGSGLIQMFIISIGLSLVIRHVILIYFGSRRPQYSDYAVQKNLDLGPIGITPRDLTVVVLSALVLVLVAVMLQRTRIGKGMRAVADNKDLAESSGIDVNRVIMAVWFIGGGLAALGGVFYGLVAKAVYWDMGFNLLLLMFAGVILGGLGSAYGAMIGSLVVGLVAQLSTLWFPVDLQNAWALLVLILVLLVRPQGILGRAERAG